MPSKSDNVVTLQDMFPEWTKSDLTSLLDDNNNDIEDVISRIMGGHATVWEDASTKKHSKKKDTTATKHHNNNNINTNYNSIPTNMPVKTRGRGNRGGRGGSQRGGFSSRHMPRSNPSAAPITNATSAIASSANHTATTTSAASGIIQKAVQQQSSPGTQNGKSSDVVQVDVASSWVTTIDSSVGPSSAGTGAAPETSTASAPQQSVNTQQPRNNQSRRGNFKSRQNRNSKQSSAGATTNAAAPAATSGAGSWAQLVKGSEQQKQQQQQQQQQQQRQQQQQKQKPQQQQQQSQQKSTQQARPVSPEKERFEQQRAKSPIASPQTPKSYAMSASSPQPPASHPPGMGDLAPSPSRQKQQIPVSSSVAANNRTLRQDAAVVMPQNQNVLSMGVRFGSLNVSAKDAEEQQKSPLQQQKSQPQKQQQQQQQPKAPTANQSVKQFQQQSQEQDFNKQTPAGGNQQQMQQTPQQQVQHGNMAPVAVQQLAAVSGFGFTNIPAEYGGALYSTDPQRAAAMGYYDPNGAYNKEATTLPPQTNAQPTPPTQQYGMMQNPYYYPYYMPNQFQNQFYQQQAFTNNQRFPGANQPSGAVSNQPQSAGNPVKNQQQGGLHQPPQSYYGAHPQQSYGQYEDNGDLKGVNGYMPQFSGFNKGSASPGQAGSANVPTSGAQTSPAGRGRGGYNNNSNNNSDKYTQGASIVGVSTVESGSNSGNVTNAPYYMNQHYMGPQQPYPAHLMQGYQQNRGANSQQYWSG